MKRLQLFCCVLLSAGSVFAADVSPYEVVWTTPSKDVNGTMPLGNGEVGLNAWIDEYGTLQFYISRIDSVDENGQLFKIGAVKISLDNKEPVYYSGREPAAMQPVSNFKQTLDTKRGVLEAQYQTASGNDISLRLWVDAHRPVIVVEAAAAKPAAATAFAEIWRTKRETIPEKETVCSDSYKASSYESQNFRNAFKTPEYDNLETIIEPDTILNLPDGLGWYHRNIHSKPYQLVAKIQGLDEFKRKDPILHRTFGAIIRGGHAKKIDNQTLQSAEGTAHRFEIAVNMKHPAAAEDWLSETQNILDAAQKVPFDERKAQHEQWWNEFWNRSWIHLTAEDGKAADTFQLTQCYALQRYVSACAGRGTLPIKFNGSIFTVPAQGRADYRQWGPGYWWQNTRLPYVSMAAAGDFEMLQPLFRTYVDMLPLCKYRTEKYFGHGGAYYPECLYFWGDIFLETYAWQPYDQRQDKLQKNGYHKYEWVGGLELALMMLEYGEYTGDETFLKETVIPFTAEILTFFDKHYSVNESGKLVMYPSQAAETWWDCTNPMTELSGLYGVIEKIERLPAELLTAETKSFTEKLKQKLPPIPTTPSPESKPMLAPAERFARRQNSETPELYAVFPFRQFTYDRPNVEWGIEALKHRKYRGAFGWRQDDVVMAYLGLGDEAAAYLLKRARTKDEGGRSKARFPVFWGPNYDWVPDQDHGGILTKGVQSLVMQCDGRKIDLFPAFPKGWNCDFKLHAPYQTVVEGRLENGKITALKVTPKEREKDVRIMNLPDNVK
ncbi:MAG: DUF5703 domain-containing protein [Planctomycetaceae bacterium]|jgi:hypothetical protein|nr:DUF5703 domain-containing protein [Planctomycetaceae bacterium]